MNRPDARPGQEDWVAYADYLEHKIELVKDDAEVDRERVKLYRQRIAELESALEPFAKQHSDYMNGNGIITRRPDHASFENAAEVLNRKGAQHESE